MALLSGLLLTVCGSLIYGTSVPTPSNLGFETVSGGCPTDWGLSNSSDFSGGTISVQSNEAIEGQYALELKASETQSDPYFNQCVDGRDYAGKTIILTAAIKFEKQPYHQLDRVWLNLVQYPRGSTTNPKPEVWESTNGGWVQRTATLRVEGRPDYICYGGALNGRDAVAWIDAFSLKVVD